MTAKARASPTMLARSESTPRATTADRRRPRCGSVSPRPISARALNIGAASNSIGGCSSTARIAMRLSSQARPPRTAAIPAATLTQEGT